MYEQALSQLRSCLPCVPDSDLTKALTIYDGDVERALNRLLDNPTVEEDVTPLSVDSSVQPSDEPLSRRRSSPTTTTSRVQQPSSSYRQQCPSPIPYDEDDEENFVPPPELPFSAQMPEEKKLPLLDGDVLSFKVKFLQPSGDRPREKIQQMIEDLLRDCQVTTFKLLSRSMQPRADYEDQVVQWKYQLEIARTEKMKSVDVTKHRQSTQLMYYNFLERFCYYSSLELHDQLMIELPDYHRYMSNLELQHSKLPLFGIVLGNCPNPGLFYIRGCYVTNYNDFSNIFCTNAERNKKNQPENVHTLKAAGMQTFLSWVDVEHDRRLMTLYFAVKIAQKQDGLQYAGYKIVIPYSSIVQLVVDLRDEESNSLSLKLKFPPQLWEANPRCTNGMRMMNLESVKQHEWGRVLQFGGEVGGQFPGCSHEALADCQWLQFQLPSKFANENCVDAKDILMKMISRIGARSTAKIYFGAVFAQKKRLPVVHDIAPVGSFRADYALKALISRGSVVTDQLFDYVETDKPPTEHIFFKYVRWCWKQCRQACEEALENLLAAVDERRTFEVLNAFRRLYSVRLDAITRSKTELCGETSTKHLPKNCVLVRKVMITPLRRLFMAPEVMMTNRVVRKFGEEHAFRCVFRDENGHKLQIKDFSTGYASDQQSTIIDTMITRTLTQGVEINQRVYHFLAWSNSQMRDHGCYMYAPIKDEKTGDVLVTIEQMRDWMGDFSNVKSVPKLMSRMGQCFTQAQPTVTLHKGMWRVDKDFEGGAGHPETAETYCFSDGCGRIAASLAKEVSRILELELIPSCFQIRFKGFKGILVVDPLLDGVRGGPKVIFRKSQQKFQKEDDDDENILEIVKYSMPSAVCLNRPMIAILDWVAERQSKELHKRLSRKVHYYLERELSTLGAMLMHEKIAAEQLTQRINLPINFMRLHNCGFTLTDEPFFRRMLVSVYRYNIANHLTKLKLFIPPSQGRCMYGVVDETGLLQYGQVFIQYSPSIRRASDKPKLHLGPVLITKNPCHVAGDCRQFEAVWQPALSHLVDVVVFPRHGPRPHPDEMAGSDLDGDEYSVIFDTDLHLLRNEEAMTFPKSVAEEYEEPPETESMVSFFLKYLRQDAIGKVSNAHLILTDKEGLFHPVCNEIAKKCSVAVDFPKSGQPAEALTPEEQSHSIPDYMANNFKPTYRSKRLNGQLYRKARKVEEVLEQTEHLESVFEDSVDRLIIPEGEDPFKGDEELKRKYRKLRDQYATGIQQLLDEYGITDEAAIVSGHIVSLKRITGMERDDYSFYHTDKIVELRYARMFHQFRENFLTEWGTEEELSEIAPDGTKVLRTTRPMFDKARQWYYLAYEDSRSPSRAPGPCKSFPWVVWDVLATYKRERLLYQTDDVQSRENPLAEALNGQIELFKRSTYREKGGYLDFVKTYCREPVVNRYYIAYGEEVVDILYVLWNWLEQEDFFDHNITPLTIHHVARIFIQYCRGISQGCEGVADTVQYALHFPQQAPNPPHNLYAAQLNPAVVLLDFLRYLSSQRFCLADHLLLRIDDEQSPPILTRQNQWMPLSQLAFRTYHSIAVSGRFDALHLFPNETYMMESENKEPLMISGDVFCTNNYSQVAIQPKVIIDTLKEWSGLSCMAARPDRIESRNRRAQYLCTIYGSVVARQKIARLLQMEPDKLLKCVKEERIPIEVYDLCL